MCVYHINSRMEFDRFTRYGVCLVDFNASWSVSCRLQEPIIDNLAKGFQGQAKIVTADVDENREIAQACNIRSIPTLILFDNGQEITRFVGLRSESVLSAALKRALSN